MTDAAGLLADRLLPRLTPDVVLDRVHAHWVFAGGVFPVPVGGWLRCPVCEGREIQLARYHFHERKGSATRYRCDVKLKCTHCSAFWTHGVVVEEDVWKRGMEGGKTARVWQYREVVDRLGINDET